MVRNFPTLPHPEPSRACVHTHTPRFADQGRCWLHTLGHHLTPFSAFAHPCLENLSLEKP